MVADAVSLNLACACVRARARTHCVLQASFGLHSMRRGAATTATNNGVLDHVIQKQMRVATGETVRRYSTLTLKTLKTAILAV